MKQYNKSACGEKITLDKYKEILVEMLGVFAEYCDKNGIKYYLSGGTLLGAVRHKGFIPWDDDIDLNIPRPDCEKLQEISKGNIGKYKLIKPGDNTVYPSNFWRLYNEDIIIEDSLNGSSKKFVYEPMFIDIFPIEGLPESDEVTKKHYKSMDVWKKLLGCTRGSLFHGNSFPAKVFHLFCRPVALMIGKEKLIKKVQDISKKYSFEDSKYVGVTVTSIHKTEEKVVKSEYTPQIDLEFEGRIFKGPAGYDKYLSQLYGKNYMELPPEEKRISHHGFELYKRKE